jgi:hypothetical protein
MSKLISVCTIKGCNTVFIIDRSKMTKPLDDPRIRHLQYDHKMERQTTLDNYFKTIYQADFIDLFVMVG